eukprot:gnl/MRDRNA2_/MRDRNA2_105885_c0_seq1.p1 gnl/MRDRNA2_/MRDRNA2_105885_c0~~gnl/MRDRNA2_/MRDRNA2_105885_c0_seq1.p1  ORF type:complete len:371 (+),score=71.25 gnl/MRDRNA2_/MRDRNA2_105885_c0_seq1:64-1176(+)
MGQELRRCCNGEHNLYESVHLKQKPAALDAVVLDELLPCSANDELLTPPGCKASRDIRVPAAALSRAYDFDNGGHSPPKARRPPKRCDSWHDEMPGLPCEDGSVAKITPTRAKPKLFSPLGGIATPLRVHAVGKSPSLYRDAEINVINDFHPWTSSMSEAIIREQQLAVAGGIPNMLRLLLAQPVGEDADAPIAENPFACDITLLAAAFQYLNEGSGPALDPGQRNVEDFFVKFTCLKSPCKVRAEISSWAPGPMTLEVFISFIRAHAAPCHVVELIAASLPEDSETGRTSRRRLTACLAATLHPLFAAEASDIARRAAVVVARSLSCERALSQMEFEAAHRRAAASSRVLAMLASGDARLWFQKSDTQL